MLQPVSGLYRKRPQYERPQESCQGCALRRHGDIPAWYDAADHPAEQLAIDGSIR
jgi:hypothetical protein